MTNGHQARALLGQHVRGKNALGTMLVEAMELLAEIASGEWTSVEEAGLWHDRYEALKKEAQQ